MPRPKPCVICETTIENRRGFQKTCSPKCAIEYVRQQEAEKQKKAHRKETRQMREKAKTKSDLLKEAQYEFNKYIRLRDRGEHCISCGRNHDGQYHAGHFLSVGSTPELRFCEDNCHSQCAPCNNHLSGNQIEYRKRLINKIGQSAVEWLEGPHEMPNWSHDDIRAIKAKYKAMSKELENV